MQVNFDPEMKKLFVAVMHRLSKKELKEER